MHCFILSDNKQPRWIFRSFSWWQWFPLLKDFTSPFSPENWGKDRHLLPALGDPQSLFFPRNHVHISSHNLLHFPRFQDLFGFTNMYFGCTAPKWSMWLTTGFVVSVLSVHCISNNFRFIFRSLRKMLKSIKPSSSLCGSLLQSSTSN